MWDVENGLAVGAGELDLRRIDPLCRKRPGRGQGWGRGADELRRQHLREVAGGADEFGQPRRDRQDRAAASASDLEAGWGRRRREWRRSGGWL